VTEEEYFAREDIEKVRKLHLDAVKHLSLAQKEELKAKHANRCPNCGMEMHKLSGRHGVSLLRCFDCGGTFIDAENAKKALGHGKKHEVVESMLSLFVSHTASKP
jgi:hypothetical protein